MILLFFLQLLFTAVFWERLTLEDAAESIRSPYWWAAGRTVLNGTASNVGYYSALAIAYRVFGFSLYLSKVLRLVLHLLSLISTAAIFRRWLGPALGIVPLLIAGTSPSWLYLNTFQAQIGFDLQVVPIMLWGILLLEPHRRKTLIGLVLLGAFFTWSALVYPTVLFYAPVLVTFGIWHLWGRGRVATITAVSASGFGGAFLIAAMFMYDRAPSLLLFDPVTRGGIFRGGGTELSFDPRLIALNLEAVTGDFFVRGQSYIFDIPHAEFSVVPAQVALAILLGCVLWIEVALLRSLRREQRALRCWLVSSLVCLLVFPQLIKWMPGLRRTTGVLFAFYALVAFLWWIKDGAPKKFRWAVTLGAALLMASNLYTDARNLKEGWPEVRTKNVGWFEVKGTPEKSLLYLHEYTAGGYALRCSDFSALQAQCRYLEIFGAIQAYRRWNGLPELPVKIWDERKRLEGTASIHGWENHEYLY